MRSEEEASRVIDLYGDTVNLSNGVFKVCSSRS